MKSSRKFNFFSPSLTSTTTTVTYTFHNDQTTPQSQPNSTQIPIQPFSNDHISQQIEPSAASATKIQSAYRGHIIRTLYKKISTVNSEANNIQSLIQRQETVDTIRSHEREKLRMNEALMGLLLRLDSVPGGIDPAVREARRKVSHRIVGLQEILDGISEARVDYYGNNNDDNVWGPHGVLRNWDEMVWKMEEEFCREMGGEEMERFCAQYLGFRCLQRFLRE